MHSLHTSLQSIREEITRHPSNSSLKHKGYAPIYTADERARILVVGQAPGRKAQETGIPWNDVSGDKLRMWLGLRHEEFYDAKKIALVPMDFYYPGKGKHGDLPPRPDFAPMWHAKILALMPHIRLTVLIGQYAQQFYLRGRVKMNLTETVRAYREYVPNLLPLVHPSPLTFRWQSQNPWFEREVVPVLQKMVRGILQ